MTDSEALDEIALATGYGERPEGQAGAHRPANRELADILTKNLRKGELAETMMNAYRNAMEGSAEALGMDPQGILEDPSSAANPLRAAQKALWYARGFFTQDQPHGMHGARCGCLWHVEAREKLLPAIDAVLKAR